jgi:hypothetical protein
MTDRTPRTTLHPNAPTPAARQALDDAWDAWDEAAHLAEVRDYASDIHNEAEAGAWARYAALKANIAAGLWPKRRVAIGDASGVTAHTFKSWVWDETDPESLGNNGEPYTTCEWQYGDDWHAERQELADYDASVWAASIYQ